MIDEGILQPWPDAVVERLAQYRQGSLVERPPFAYHASGMYPLWVASRLAAEDPEDELLLVELDIADGPPYGIITTQSCDVDEEGKNRKPWVQLAPVYELPSENPSLGNVRAWKYAYLAPVTALGPTWVVDLRIELPVEKSWLVRQPPRPGFTTPEEFDRFARFLGGHRTRLQLATAVHERLLKPLGASLVVLAKEEPGVHEAFGTEVKHLFIDVRGDPLLPEAIQLIFVGERSVNETVVGWLEAWWERVYSRSDLPFTLLPNRYLAFDDVRFAEQRTWLEPELARLASES